MRIVNMALLIMLLGVGRPAHAQCQIAKILASDITEGDEFGLSISVSGDWMIVGAPINDDVGLSAGAAYMFQRQGSTWVEAQKLHASDGNGSEHFGVSVAISGDVAVVGANLDSPGGNSTAGSAYVFERVGSTWTETAKLIASDAAPQDQFGQRVAVANGRLLISAPFNSVSAFVSGAAYVFEKQGGTWTQIVRLTPNDAAMGDGFGASVAIEGDRIVIGAPGVNGPAGESDVGALYVFELVGGSWVQGQKLFANDLQALRPIGYEVALSGSAILTGRAVDNSQGPGSGSAYVFEEQGGVWRQAQKLYPLDPNPSNQFGASVALAGDTALIGADVDSDFGFQHGSAYVFRRVAGTWIQAGKMLPADAADGDVFGARLALIDDTAIIGVPFTDDACPGMLGCNSGSVYLFELAPTAVQYGSCKTLAPCSNWDDHGGCRNSIGEGAMLAACGLGSVSTDDLRLEVTKCPPFKLTLLFMGQGQNFLLYGDGLRVVSAQPPSGVYRYGGAATDAQGRVMRGPGLVAHSQGFPFFGRIQSGQTWNFQYWYRDPMGPCGGLTNFSNGVEVAFGP